jgi:hypothetical protein
MAGYGTSRYETRIDRQIREAQERGDFDNLPGSGKPLKSTTDVYDEEWWIKDLAQRENLSAALPPALALRREIQDLPETLAKTSSEKAVRDHLTDLNERIVAARRSVIEGPPITVKTVDVEPTVVVWRAARSR